MLKDWTIDNDVGLQGKYWELDVWRDRVREVLKFCRVVKAVGDFFSSMELV